MQQYTKHKMIYFELSSGSMPALKSSI